MTEHEVKAEVDGYWVVLTTVWKLFHETPEVNHQYLTIDSEYTTSTLFLSGFPLTPETLRRWADELEKKQKEVEG